MPSVWSFSRGSVTALPVFDKSKLEHQISIESLKKDDPIGNTSADVSDMARMGRIQELRVCIAFLPITLVVSPC
jgi:hypothetical protein